MIAKSLGADGAQVWASRGGEIRLWSPAPGVLCCSAKGDIPEELAPPYMAFLQQIAAQPARITAFNDLEFMVNYHTAYRTRITQAHRQLIDRTDGNHILVRSRLVMLGVQAANLVLGNIVAYSTRETYDAALAKVVALRRAR
jgi:hypothetical protein